MDTYSKIFVAGHCGLVGSAIVRRLRAEGAAHLILRTSKELDLRSQAAVDAFFVQEKPEYVFLAAARVGGILANSRYPADFIRDNLQIQTNVIDAAYRNHVRRLLFLGSSCIYPKLAPQPMPESCLLTGALEPTNAWYAIAKISGIKMCQAYHKQYGFDARSVMPTNLYGPNDNFDLEKSHVLPALIRKFHLAKLAAEGDVEAIAANEVRYGRIPDDILHNLGFKRTARDPSCLLLPSPSQQPKVILWGTGSPRREFLHVNDLAAACLFLMKHEEGEEMINVGMGGDITIRELAELVRDIVGFQGGWVWDSAMPDGTPRKLMDISRLLRLGWKASMSLRQGIEQTYRWYLT